MRLEVYRLKFSPEWRYVVRDVNRNAIETAVRPTWREAFFSGLEAGMRRYSPIAVHDAGGMNLEGSD